MAGLKINSSNLYSPRIMSPNSLYHKKFKRQNIVILDKVFFVLFSMGYTSGDRLCDYHYGQYYYYMNTCLNKEIIEHTGNSTFKERYRAKTGSR